MNTTSASHSFKTQLDSERKRFAIAANGVIAAPIAGGIYWSALAIISPLVSIEWWCVVAFFSSGLIFPLALALQRPTRSNMMIKNHPLGGAGGFAFANIALGWAIAIPAFHTDPQLLPLALGIGMSLHLTGTAWAMDLKAYLYHPILRGAIIVILWYSLPEDRFLAIPIAIAVIYFATVPAVLREISGHRLRLAGVA